MNKPRIVIIRDGEWNCTQAIPRTLDALEAMGLRATVLCWDLTGRQAATDMVNGHRILRFRRYVPPRSIRLFLWWPAWWCWVLWQLFRGRFHIVHAMNFGALPPAVAGRMIFGYRLIYDVRDALGLVLANIRWPVPQVFTVLERTLALASDGLVLSQGDIEACTEYFGRRATRTLPTVQVLNVPTVEPPATYRQPVANPLRINVSGYISPVRGAFILTDAFGQRDDVICDIVGEMRYSAIEERLVAMGNANLHGRVPYEKALELMDQADLIWLHYDNSLKSVVVSSTNKMFEAMMLGKPYLTADGCWMAEIAQRFGLGWTLPYGDVDALRRLVEKLNANPSLLVEAGRRGREAFEKHFTWPKQRENLLRLYRYVIEGGPDDITARRHEGWNRFIGLD
ncbi:MAG: glycosyltransferase [Phycisphaerae bacterium]|nr:glycosyltransferase [Phycisphaerae bacterium]